MGKYPLEKKQGKGEMKPHGVCTAAFQAFLQGHSSSHPFLAFTGAPCCKKASSTLAGRWESQCRRKGLLGVLIAAWVGPGLGEKQTGKLMPGSREGGACKNISGLKAPSTAIPPRTIQRPFGAHSDLRASSCPHILKKTRPLRGQKHSPPDTPSQAASR